MTHWKPITDLPTGRQFVWAKGSHGESFPIVVWTDGERFYPAFMDTPEKGAEPYADDTFARWLPLADMVAAPVNAHAGLVAAAEAAEQCIADFIEVYKRGASMLVLDEAVKSLRSDALVKVRAALEEAKP